MNESLIDATCGAISGVLANLFTHPFDTVKCRMQTDPQKYKSIQSTVIHILKNEKFLGFYKGIFANSLISIPINSVQFMVFGQTKRFLKKKKYFSKYKHVNYFLSGCAAGLATLFFVVPLEMIKCNQQINFQGKTKKENRFIKKTHHIYRKGRITGFYRGLCVTVNRDLISTGIYFCLYYTLRDKFKKQYPEHFGSAWEGVIGGLAGLMAWSVSYPFDTIKTIVQTAHFKDKTPKQIEVIKQLKQQGGLLQMYRGATPSILLSVLFSSLTFIFFEISKDLLYD